MRFSCLFNYEHLVNSTDHRIGVLMIPILKKYDETESSSGPQPQAPTSCPLGWVHFGFFRTQPVLRVRPPSVPSSGISRPSWIGYKYFTDCSIGTSLSHHTHKNKNHRKVTAVVSSSSAPSVALASSEISVLVCICVCGPIFDKTSSQASKLR